MSETPEINPALNAEEWRAFLADEEVPRVTHVVGPDLARLHGAAAKMLYGHPFGFTHEDVELLREAAYSDCVEGDREWVALTSLADRIAALLPPKP